MSAYLSSSDTLSALANYWFESVTRERHADPTYDLARAIYQGSPALGWDEALLKTRELLTNRNPALVVYELLLSENQASLEARYPTALEYRSADGYCYSPDPAVKRSVIHNKTGWIVDLVRGYEYQSCEHDSWRQSIGHAICMQIRQHLNADLQRLQDPDRKAGHWASYDRRCWDQPAQTKA
jgi:hypothetical protein